MRADVHRFTIADPSDVSGLKAAIEAMTNEIEPPSAKATLLETLTELCNQLSDVTRDRLRRADRLGKGAPNFDQVRRPDRDDWLCDFTECLAQSAGDLGTIPQNERGTRLSEQVTSHLEAEDPQLSSNVRWQPQTFQR